MIESCSDFFLQKNFNHNKQKALRDLNGMGPKSQRIRKWKNLRGVIKGRKSVCLLTNCDMRHNESPTTERKSATSGEVAADSSAFAQALVPLILNLNEAAQGNLYRVSKEADGMLLFLSQACATPSVPAFEPGYKQLQN
jgi:hypothetical protein